MTMELKRHFSMENFTLCLPKLNPLIFLRINMLGVVLIIKNFAAENCKRLLQWMDLIYSGFLNWIPLALTCFFNVPFSLALNGHFIHVCMASFTTSGLWLQQGFWHLLSIPKNIRIVTKGLIHGQNQERRSSGIGKRKVWSFRDTYDWDWLNFISN